MLLNSLFLIATAADARIRKLDLTNSIPASHGHHHLRDGSVADSDARSFCPTHGDRMRQKQPQNNVGSCGPTKLYPNL
jgi:hypothetical protein